MNALCLLLRDRRFTRKFKIEGRGYRHEVSRKMDIVECIKLSCSSCHVGAFERCPGAGFHVILLLFSCSMCTTEVTEMVLGVATRNLFPAIVSL